ncbi:MAG: nitrate- and nitrite sensing domain-containing protein [Magnetospirillum sp.]|nr:nitrate- and nitrite sensing domain-containing protein [Magnetospirillum sp.]
MAPLEWNEGLVVGVESIDSSHRFLIDLLDRVHAARDCGNGNACARLLREFLTAFARHIEEENGLLSGFGYPDVPRRRSEYMTSQAVVSARPLDDDDIELIGQIVDYCHAWLLDHLVRQDEPLRMFFARSGHPKRRLGSKWRRLDIITLRWRIALLAAVPLVALVVLAVAAFGHLKDTAQSMVLAHQLNELNGQVGTLVHELQRERGLSTLYMSDRSTDRHILDEQIKRTDQAHGRFDLAVAGVLDKLPPGAARERIEASIMSLDIIPEIRGDVAERSFDAIQSMDIYTTAIDDLTAVVPDVIRIILPSNFSKNTFAYMLLLEAKERAGRERAVGVALLAPGAPIRFKRDIKELAAEQRALIEAFTALVPPEMAAAFQSAGDAEQGSLAIMRRSLHSGETGGISPSDWFETASDRIDRMAAVQSAMFQQMTADVEGLQQTAVDRAIWLGGGLVALVLLAFAMVAGLGWTVLPPLRRLGSTLKRLAEGERAFRIPGLASGDELGDIARRVQLLQERLVQGDLLEARRWTENAERLRSVTDHLPGVVFRIAQPQGRSIFLACVSHKLREITGLSPSEVVDMPVRSILRRVLLPQDRTTVFHALHRAGVRPVDIEFRVRPGFDGRVRWLRVLASPTRTEQGVVWDGVALDVSGLRRAEEEKARIAAELNRVYQLQATAQLTGGISRDLDAMLQPVLEHAERIAQAISPDSPAYQDVVAMLRATREARRLGDQIACIGGNDGQPRSPVDAVGVVGRYLETLRPALPANVALESELDGVGCLVAASEAEIERIAASLCAYAIGALSHQGGVLTVRTSAEDTPLGRQLAIRIGDSGRGVEKEALARVFSSRYFPAVSEAGDELRLAIVQAIIARCGGRLEAATRPGRGTVFEVHLPTQEPKVDNVIVLRGEPKWLQSR